jgi:hypothetical protein
MTNVVDLFTRKTVEVPRPTVAELAAYARAVLPPDFVKRRGRMVVTDEYRESVDAMFATFHLRIRHDIDVPDGTDRVLNTWAFLGAKVATALENLAEGNWELVRHTRPPEFCDYVLAVAEHRAADAAAAAERYGVLDGMPDSHPMVALMTL